MSGLARALVQKTKEKLSRDFVATSGAWKMGFRSGPQFSPIRGRSSKDSESSSARQVQRSKAPPESSDSLETKKFQNPADAIETSAYINFRKSQCMTGHEEYIQGHMTICKGYVRVFWMLQLLTYSAMGVLFAFYFPKFTLQIVIWTFCMVLSAGMAATVFCRRRSVSVCMFMDKASGNISMMVPTHGIKKDPKIFITIPPQHTGTVVGADFESLLSDSSLLMNQPTTFFDKINLKLLSNKKFLKELQTAPKGKGASPNCGLIVINEPIHLDSWLGQTNGLPISFNEVTRDALLEFSKKNEHLLSGSNFGSQLLRVCKETKKSN